MAATSTPSTRRNEAPGAGGRFDSGVFFTRDIAMNASLVRVLPRFKPRDPERPRHRSIIPGFGLTLGWTIIYLSLVVLVPLAGVFIKASGLGWNGVWQAVTE